MPDLSSESINSAFQGYYRQRYHRAYQQYECSRMLGKITLGQISWLPLTPYCGKQNVLPQEGPQSSSLTGQSSE
ncbi:hypothetical protein BGZ76_011447 [Entomortierella beljakovae]|nr:hypothetical protein BGZ76_011447 [Entomortierella beljakovae]